MSKSEQVLPEVALPAALRRALPPTVIALEHGRRDYLLRRMLAIGDLAAISCALGVAAAIASAERSAMLGYLFWGLLALPGWLVIFKAYGLYDRDIKRISHMTIDDLPWVFHATAIGSVLLWGYYAVLPVDKLLFREVLAFAVTAMAGVLVIRWLVRGISARALGAERVALLGDGPTLRTLAHKIGNHPEYRLEVVGAIDVPGTAGVAALPPEQGQVALGQLEDLTDIASQHGLERLVMAHTSINEGVLLDVLRRCKELSLKVSVIPQMFDVMGPSVEIDDVEGITLLGINPPVLSRSSRFLKRSMDVVGSVVALVVLSPLLAAIAIAVKLTSRGPVLFRQERIGQAGRVFRVAKFRTMSVDAEERRAELLAASMDPNWLHLEHDPRITRVGRVLRTLSLDELPQIWNVLRGEMSLVGPRPLIPDEDRRVEGWARTRLDLTPGITGAWQVLGRTNIPFEEMVKLDYLYVTNWSLWNDLRLIVHTLPAVVLKRGAN